MTEPRTNWAIYKALPADERDRMGFAEHCRLSRIGTHGPECWKWGQKHYECALRRIAALEQGFDQHD